MPPKNADKFACKICIQGWMQLIILVYHITEAKQDLSIYMFIRVLVSAYIFLNGYGHLHYHWKRQLKSLAINNVAAKETFDSSEIVRCLTVSCLTISFNPSSILYYEE